MKYRAFYLSTSEIDGIGCFILGNWFSGDSIEINSAYQYEADEYSVETEDGTFCIEWPFFYINHSSEPNAELWQIDGENFELVLLRDIADGEEITIHYGEDWE